MPRNAHHHYVPEVCDLWFWTGLIPVQPGYRVLASTLLLHLTLLARLKYYLN